MKATNMEALTSSVEKLCISDNVPLSYPWEQCLDLKTGEIYYINWGSGKKVVEDDGSEADNGGFYYSEDDEEDNNSSYGSEESSSESFFSSSSSSYCSRRDESVLVVTGCKSCLMYFMVPKHLQECPRCSNQLLHFDSS